MRLCTHFFGGFPASQNHIIRNMQHLMQGLSGVSGVSFRDFLAISSAALFDLCRGLENLCFILSSALSRFSRLFGHFLHFLSLSLKISCATCKTFKRTFNAPLAVSLAPFSVSFSVSLTEYAASFGKICRSFNRK